MCITYIYVYIYLRICVNINNLFHNKKLMCKIIKYDTCYYINIPEKINILQIRNQLLIFIIIKNNEL